MSLPSPQDLGFPSHFAGWRKYQDDAILDLAAADERFVGLVAPTGSGKSLTYMAYARLCGAPRVAILTSTKSLQDQLERDFDELDIRGKSNYDCVEEEGRVKVDDGPCQTGWYCELRDNRVGEETVPGWGCFYYDKMKQARTAPVVITNYALWLSVNIFGRGLGEFDLLVLDEAHAAPDELAGFLSCGISRVDARNILGMDLPSENPDDWWPWLREALDKLNNILAFPRDWTTVDERKRLKRAKGMSSRIAQVLNLGKDHWVAEATLTGMTWDITDPSPFAERYLFRGIPRVVLSSATVRQKTLELLGIDSEDSLMLEYPSLFPPGRRPIYVVQGSPRMNYRTPDDQLDVWAKIIDEVINGRQKWRGIVHTVSFARAKDLQRRSQWSDIMVLHDPGSEGLKNGMREFLQRCPAVLVSPSVTTGIDMAYDSARYQIVAKLPYPDMRSKVLKARMKIDPDYPAYIAAQSMVQATGRVCRAEDDYGETFVTDGSYGWFMSRYRDFTPGWWREAVRKVTRIPTAPVLTYSPRRV